MYIHTHINMYMPIYALGVGLVHVLGVNIFAYIHFNLSNSNFFHVYTHTHIYSFPAFPH